MADQAAPQTLTIPASRGEYPVWIEPGGLASSWSRLAPWVEGRATVIVTQRRLRRLFGKTLLASWPKEQPRPLWLEVPQGEGAKSLAWMQRLLVKMARAKLTRKAVLLALGGGVVGDLAGFVAASYMRGISWIQLPTSLLAQVDSSVGGKVAVNLPQGKNLVGAFYPPDAVLIDPDTLASLPRRELLAGEAEVAKYGLIRDADFFARCERELPDPPDFAPLLAACVRHKAEVVAQDERETGARMALNLGHTMGHAIEAVGRYKRYVHGEAVALGTRYVYRLAARLGAASAEDAARVDAFFAASGIAPPYPCMRFESLLKKMRGDKKADDGGIRWVLPTGIGGWRLEAGVDEALLREVHESLWREARA